MSISVRMTQDWECPEDADRNVVRRYPNGLVLEMTDDVAETREHPSGSTRVERTTRAGSR